VYPEKSERDYSSEDEGEEEEADISPPQCLTTPMKKAFCRQVSVF
jgi:hypothetical protein